MEHYGTLGVSWMQGYKGDKIYHVDPIHICFVCGNIVKFINIFDGEENVFLSPGNGISKMTTLPSSGLFAFAETGLNPRIFVCQFPSMNVMATLKDAANLEYTQLAFSTSGKYLVACSGLPDFSLFVWNWKTETLRCQEKLLNEQESTSLMFNPLNDHQISLIGPEQVTLWLIEECNQIAALTAKKVNLPASDGTVVGEAEDPSSRSGTRLGFHVPLPASTRAGLEGEKTKNFLAPENRHPRVRPSSQCWSTQGDVLVGCDEGQLFRINADSGKTNLLLGGMSDALVAGEAEPGMFNCMELNNKGLFVGGKDGVLRQIQMDNNGLRINQAHKAADSISSVRFSPGAQTTLSFGTIAGSLHCYNSVNQQHHQVSSTGSGKFVGVSFTSGGRFCVTCREDGEVQAWESETGKLVGSLSLGTRVTTVACCPSCWVVAVGTWTGHVIYVDISSLYSEEENRGLLRQVGCTRIHHAPVNFLVYDNAGRFLLCASDEENQVFVIDPKPSTEFNCIGYVDCKGTVNSLAIHQTSATKASVVATVTSQFVAEEEGDNAPSQLSNVVVIFTLTDEILAKPDDHYQSLRHNFKDASVNCVQYELTTEVDSAVITNIEDSIELAALSQRSKKLLRFKLASQKRQSQSEDPGLCPPTSDHTGHELGGGFLSLSSHGRWLASSSPDGNLIIRDLLNWDSVVTLLVHSFMEGGAKAVAFSPDANQIASVGLSDSSLVCLSWEFKSQGQKAGNAAVEHTRLLNMQLRSTVESEAQVLGDMKDWVHPLHESSSQVDESQGGAEVDERPITGAPSEITMTPTPTPSLDATWLDEREAMAVKEESAKFDEVKRLLRKEIKEMRKTILRMMADNENLPEIEQLRHDEYNLDTEEQKRMQDKQDREVQEVREEIYFENLAQRYLAYLIKKECWDDMVTKGRAITAFNANVSVSNYPTLHVTSAESALLEKVTRMRKIEMAANAVRKSVVEIAAAKSAAGGGGEDDEDDEEGVGGEGAGGVGGQLSLHGSLGPNYSGDSEFFYSQFELHTKEEKFSQIVLVKDAIRRIKDAFNESFSNVYRNKEQEISRIKERNVRIRQIMMELGMEAETVTDPSLGENEMPEKVFVVSDDEVTVERVLSEEQKREKEEEERVEEERKAAAKGDNKRERALVDMMGGVLEVKKEDMLKQDIPPPDCMTEKLEKDWSDEDKKKIKDYEKKMKDLQDEREKYRKNLENELKKLQQSNVDGMSGFDDSLNQLFNKRVKVDMVVNQEELKILRMTRSIMVDDELKTHEANLNYLLNVKSAAKVSAAEREAEVRRLVDEYREVYDSVVAEDKMLDRGFKREFSDVPLSLADQLYKLFRRRPRLQKQQRAVTDRSGSIDISHVEKGGSVVGGESVSTLSALEELDSDVNMPEGCDAHLWSRLCHSRRVKVESEIRVKQSAVTLAEMTQYLQRRQEEDDGLACEIDDVTKQQTKLYEDIMKNMLNIEVQFLLKQGRVEITCGPFIADYSDSILIHRGVVEDLNGTIRGLGESKVAAMTESKDFKKGIHQLEWDRKRMMMQMEDLNNKSRHIQMLKLTKDLQAFLNEENQSGKQAKQMAVLEETLKLQNKQLEKNVSHKNETTHHLSRTIRLKEHENKELDKVLEGLHVTVSERKNIANVNATERAKSTSDKRLKGIVQRRKLVDLAKAQAQEVAVLRAEVERLRMKTFPALVQVER
uniref:Cilia- and flagella-associated protein 43 n=1 Tax=Phallusia mammillata TaxID=59560 RepID=A0A6F9D8J7_9ASCI|nr:WD repeat-containing protein 96-like [Phallusia mammillata]